MKNYPTYLLGLLMGVAHQAGAQEAPPVVLNQVGFYPQAPKLAVVTALVSGSSFYVLTAEGKDTVFRGVLGEERQSAYSATRTRKADFTPLQRPGRYVVAVPGAGISYPFAIGAEIHRPVAMATLKGFYYQRSDEPLLPRHAGQWHRGAGHPDTVVHIHPSAASNERPAGTRLSSPGGWYDAGDYNKYIVNSGITMGTLLAAYEDYPAYYGGLEVNIPESSNGVPDLLDESLYNLRWMLTMQDPGDGGVYHKCTNAFFDGMVMPGVTRAPRYLVQKSTPAALDFAAVMAQAARVYKKYNGALPGLADSLLSAAVRAWQWAVQHPAVRYSQRELNSLYEPDITTGEYGDRSFGDEWLWAAAELFATTGERPYYAALLERMGDPVGLPSWGNVAMLGYYTVLRHQGALPGYAKGTAGAMRDSVVRLADQFIARSGVSAFGTVMGQSVRDFIWGSSSVAANQGILLLNAYRLSGERKYADYALTNLDYLLGRNATGYCFVTGVGSRYPMRPHHRPSVADGIEEPVPGLLSGGPNPGMQDKCVYPSAEPEKAFSDTDCSYASNEIAINWNAPMVYLAGALDAVMGRPEAGVRR